MTRKTAIIAISAVVVAAALVGVGVVATGFAASEDPGDGNDIQQRSASQISVSASGEARAQPNKAIVEVEVRATAENASTARSRVARNVTAVREALLALGIDESRVTTTDFDIYRRAERPRRAEEGEERVVSHARHELRVELNSVDDAGQVIDTAVDNGATNVGDVRFTVSRETRQELRQEALADAMENARADAETLATGANLTITGVDVVTTGATHDVDRRRAHEATPAADAGGGGTNVEAGPVSVTATVSVSYNATAGR